MAGYGFFTVVSFIPKVPGDSLAGLFLLFQFYVFQKIFKNSGDRIQVPSVAHDLLNGLRRFLGGYVL